MPIGGVEDADGDEVDDGEEGDGADDDGEAAMPPTPPLVDSV